jgi:hypothetical protein
MASTPHDPNSEPKSPRLPAGSPSDRLANIRGTDLTESRVNEEFLTWLRTKGLNWLLLILVMILAWMGWDLWQQRAAERRDAAWLDLGEATLPVSLDEVAARHAGIDSVAVLAQISAGDRYLSSVQSGLRFDREPDQPDYRLTPEDRESFLASAETAYRSAADRLGDPAAVGMRSPLLIAALVGRAAVAESRGDLEATAALLEEASRIAGERYPIVNRWATQRIEELPKLAAALPIPPAASLPQRAPLQPLAPMIVEDLLQDLAAPPPPPPAEPSAAPSPAPFTLPPSTLPPIDLDPTPRNTPPAGGEPGSGGA